MSETTGSRAQSAQARVAYARQVVARVGQLPEKRRRELERRYERARVETYRLYG